MPGKKLKDKNIRKLIKMGRGGGNKIQSKFPNFDFY